MHLSQNQIIVHQAIVKLEIQYKINDVMTQYQKTWATLFCLYCCCCFWEEREERGEKAWSLVGGEVEKIWKELGERKKHDQNIMYEKSLNNF